MRPRVQPKPAFRFDPFEVNLNVREVRRNGHRVRLQEHSFRILSLLLERPGEVVTRTELREALWPDGTIVDFENGLNAAMGKLRQALRDSASHPRYIETVARTGYRFIARLETAAEELPPTERPRWAGFHHAPALAGVLILTLAAVFGVVQALHRQPPRSSPAVLAVLPFRDLSSDRANQYLADGVAEELTTYLSRLDPASLRVISRLSDTESATAVTRELHADYLLDGSVRREQEKVRIAVRLIRASDQIHVWDANYDHQLGDELALEGEIAGAVAYRIQGALSGNPSVPATRKPARTVVPAAYDACLKGRFYLWSSELSRASSEAAAESFREALRADPGYAPAYSGLAEYHCGLPEITGDLDPEDISKARQYAARALELDPQLAEAHLAAAWTAMLFDANWAVAGREFQQTLQLDPNLVRGRALDSVYLLAVGRPEQAVEQIRSGLRTDPMSLTLRSHASRTFFLARRYDEAAAECRKRLEINPTLRSARASLADIDVHLGRCDDALAELRELADSGAASSETSAYVQARCGSPAEARRTVAAQEKLFHAGSLSSYRIALLHAALGEIPQALSWIERAYQDRNPFLFLRINTDPRLDPLRPEPRFQQVVRQLHYPE